MRLSKICPCCALVMYDVGGRPRAHPYPSPNQPFPVPLQRLSITTDGLQTTYERVNAMLCFILIGLTTNERAHLDSFIELT